MCFVLTRTVKMRHRTCPWVTPKCVRILAATSLWLTAEWRDWNLKKKKKRATRAFAPFASFSRRLHSVAGRRKEGSVAGLYLRTLLPSS